MIARNACDGKRIYSRKINSDAHAVCREVTDILDQLKASPGINTDQYFDIKVILSELLQNAIRHGNEFDHTKQIGLDVWLQDDNNVLGISVEDQGDGFDVGHTLEKKRKRAMDNDDILNMDEFGRGLLIIENLCDDIHYNHKGNKVTVHKNLH